MSTQYLKTKNYKESSNAVVAAADKAFNTVKETVASKSWKPLVVVGKPSPFAFLALNPYTFEL